MQVLFLAAILLQTLASGYRSALSHIYHCSLTHRLSCLRMPMSMGVSAWRRGALVHCEAEMGVQQTLLVRNTIRGENSNNFLDSFLYIFLVQQNHFAINIFSLYICKRPETQQRDRPSKKKRGLPCQPRCLASRD